MHWLGPLTTTADFYTNLSSLLSKAWFHGSVGTSEAEHRLADRSDGCFLIRFSTTSPGSFTLSKNKGSKTVHQRIDSKNGLFHVGSRSYNTLEALLQSEYENLGLKGKVFGSFASSLKKQNKGACPGSKYSAVFQDLAAAGSSYVEAND